jgi:hypothetical protein
VHQAGSCTRPDRAPDRALDKPFAAAIISAGRSGIREAISGAVMKTLINLVVPVAAFALLSPSLLAQWPPYSTSGVPRTSSGEPRLDAPTPRTADGKPDLSGIWRGAAAGQQGLPADPPAGVPLATFRNVGAGFKDGLPLQPFAAELLKKRVADNSRGNPEAHCLPMGIMQFHTQGAPRKFIQTPGLLVILYEASSGIRQIFTDGRRVPDSDAQPWWYGYSIGTWDGDTLVVETSGLRDGGWLDIIGSPLTDAAKLTERFRRVRYGRMEIDVTVDDKKAYTRPWTVRVNQQIMPDTDLIEFICLENQRFPPQ